MNCLTLPFYFFQRIFFLLLFAVAHINLFSYTLELYDTENSANSYLLSDSAYSYDLNEEQVRAFNLRYLPDHPSASKVEFYLNNRLISSDQSADGSGYYQMYNSGSEWLPGPLQYNLEVKTLTASNIEVDSVSVSLDFTDGLDHRMRTVRISGLPADTQIDINMLQHAFPFGSMVEYKAELTVENEPNYLGTFVENFNYTVPGNVGKWYHSQPDWYYNSPHRNNFQKPGVHRFDELDDWLNRIEALEVANDIEIGVRGHTLLWGAKGMNDQSTGDRMHDPNWVEAIIDLNGNGFLDNNEKIDANFEEFLYWIEQRIRQTVRYFKDRITEWDFNNELYNNDFYTTFLSEYVLENYGISMYKLFSNWALDEDPNIKLWYNDYGIIASGNQNNANAFKALLEDLISQGVPVDGIGLEGHFGSPSAAANVDRIKSILDNLATLGVPIKITEFDTGWEAATINGVNRPESTELEEANALEDVYRTCFEHPSVNGIIMWGFWEGEHWKPWRASWNTDWTPTLQADRFRSLVWDEWHSDAQVVTDSNGIVEFAVFAGNYDITVDGQTIRQAISADNTNITFLQYASGSLSEVAGKDVAFVSPVSGQSFSPNSPIEIEATVIGGSVSELEYVDFSVNGELFKRDSVYPFTAKWYDAPTGISELTIFGKNAENSLVPKSIFVSVGDMTYNQSANPGFEEATVQGSASLWSNRGEPVILSKSSESFSGASSAKISNRANNWHGIQQNITGMLQHGEDYQISCYVKSVGAQTLKIQIRDVHSNGTWSQYQGQKIQNVNSNEWTKIESNFTFDDYRNEASSFNPTTIFVEVNSTSSSNNPTADFYVDQFYIGQAVDTSNDTNTNGIPDSWENSTFSVTLPFVSALDDADGDGINNIMEWRHGTDPIDSNSKFSFAVNPNPEQAYDLLTWTGSSLKSYKILTKEDLNDLDWTIYREQHIGGSGKFQEIPSAGVSKKFFKVVIDE